MSSDLRNLKMNEYLLIAFDKTLDAFKLVYTTDNESSPRDPSSKNRLKLIEEFCLLEGYGQEFRDRMYGYLWQYFDKIDKCFKCSLEDIKRYIVINSEFFKEFRNISILIENNA